MEHGVACTIFAYRQTVALCLLTSIESASYLQIWGYGFGMIFLTASKHICRVVYKKPSLIFVILPLAFLFCVLLLKSARGPYWRCINMDPDYTYLINSLNFAEGLPIGHRDHPGTTLQVAGAWILKSFHFFRDVSPLAEDVLKNPEVYLGFMNRIFLGLTIFLMFLAGWLGFRKSGEQKVCSPASVITFFFHNNSFIRRAHES